MAMEYYIDVDCELKRSAGGMTQLMEYNKKRGIVKMMVEVIGAQQPGIDIMSQKTVRETYTPDGVKRQEEVTVGQLKTETDWMYQWVDYCGQCENAFLLDDNAEKGELIGCYGSIKYPISGIAETIVGMALEACCKMPKGELPRMIIDYILDNNVTGQKIVDMRKRGLFELNKPKAGKVGTFKKVTTDQIFEVLFFFEHTPVAIKGVVLPFMAVVLEIYKQAPPEVRASVRSDECTFYLVGMTMAFDKAAKLGKNVKTVP